MCSGPGPHAIELRGIRFSYGGGALFDGLRLDAGPGVTGVVGPNGCGKSTLLKVAAGLAVPEAGEVRIGGAPLRGMTCRQRARLVALMPQDVAAVPMSVADLAMHGRYAHLRPLRSPGADDRRAVEEALGMAGVDGLSDRPVSSLSGGQRQRAYIAMTLAQQAGVVLLDEPTSALDIGAAHGVLRLVREVQARGSRTVLVAIHDLDLALRYCDRIVVMDHGAIVQVGTPDEVAAGAALPGAFGVSVHRVDAPAGRSWAFFPEA